MVLQKSQYSKGLYLLIFLLMVLTILLTGCLSEPPKEEDFIAKYQQSLSQKGPLKRESDKELGLLKQSAEPSLPQLDITKDPNTGEQLVSLSIEDALFRALKNNPEIRVVSFEPSIAREDIIKAIADFDIISFGSYNYDKQDNPENSIFLGGQSDFRSGEVGFKQKNILGTELSATYALARNWDNLTTRNLSTRYEPILAFQLKQPLLRDGWEEFNKAGINIATLNYKISLVAFRQKTEEMATQVITAYWTLLQAKRDVEIQRFLLKKTQETLNRVQERKGIDATYSQIQQAETYYKQRQSTLLAAEKNFLDVQDVLLRLLSDSQINILKDIEVLPITTPALTAEMRDQTNLLNEAMSNNPFVQQARIGIDVAQINIKVAQNQALPRLDMVSSSRFQGLERGYGSANRELFDGDYSSWAIGASAEYPLGNRRGKAELRKREFELAKAITNLQNTSDEVALATKEKFRLLELSLKEIQVQKEAVAAAEIYLKGMEDMEEVRTSLTPEFLFVKLQAQESLADAQRGEIKAIVDFNKSLVQLAQATGTVLKMQMIQTAMLGSAK
jgi:outer membrane protein TolC